MLLLVFCALALWGAMACTDSTQTEGPCKIKYHVCTGTYDWQVVYTCQSTDTKSGISGSSSGHHHSADGSCYDASVAMYNKMYVTPTNATTNATNPCNCFTNIEDLGPKCILQVTVCFYFLSQADLQNSKPAYKAWTFDEQTGLSGYSANTTAPDAYNATAAVVSSLTALVTAEPNLALRCPKPPALSGKETWLELQA